MSAVYDVIIVGGGPMGLSSAYECYNKGKKVLVIDQFEFLHNDFGSSPGFSRQFRISYSEKHLCELANLTSPLWDRLMLNLNNPKLLSRTGCLWFGDSTVSNSEGNITAAIKNLIELSIPYEHVRGADNIRKQWPFVGNAIDSIDCPEALYMDDGGTVNVLELIQSYVKELQVKNLVQLLPNTKVTRIDYSQQNKVTSTQTYEGTKVILTPGAYVNEVLSLLFPTFGQRIKFKIYLWVSTYYQLKLEALSERSAIISGQYGISLASLMILVQMDPLILMLIMGFHQIMMISQIKREFVLHLRPKNILIMITFHLLLKINTGHLMKVLSSILKISSESQCLPSKTLQLRIKQLALLDLLN